VQHSRTLRDLSLGGCKLGDTLASKVFGAWIHGRNLARGALDLSVNLLAGHIFQQADDKSEKPNEAATCKLLNFSGNLLTDEAIGPLTRLIERVEVESLDLSGNRLGKDTLVWLRERAPSVTTIDLSGNHLSLVKSASILELREPGDLQVRYTKEQTTIKKPRKL